MLISNVLIIFTMLLHPNGLSGAPDQNTMMKWVHGTLIVLLILNAFGFGVVISFIKAKRRDTNLCLLFYYVGLGSIILAALISGFVQTSLEQSFSDDREALLIFNKFSWIVNQSLSKLGLVSYGAAGLLLVPITAWAERGLRLVGLVSGLVGSILVVSILIGAQLSVSNMTMLSIFIVLWHAAIGVYLIKGQKTV